MSDPLRHLSEHPPVVNFLKGLAILLCACHLANKQHHWRGSLVGDMDSRTRIGCSGATGDEANPRLPGQAAIGLRHHRGTTLLSAGDHLDVGSIAEGVEHGEVALTWHTENTINFLCLQALDQDLAAAQCHWRLVDLSHKLANFL